MTIPRPFKILGTGATVAGLFIGSAALAGAVTNQATPDTTSVSVAGVAAPATEAPGVETPDANEAPGTEANEANEAPGTETNDGAEDPSYMSSIAAPAEVAGQSEADESAALAPLATITADQASAAAQTAVPGEVISVELENENGAVVYGVQIGNSDVKVDAGNGSVLHIDAGND